MYNILFKKKFLLAVQIEEKRREVQRLKELQKKQKEHMMFVSNFGRQQSPSFNMYGSPYSYQPSSGFHHEEVDTTNTDHAMVDQYINFDALNIHPNKNMI